MDDDLRQPSPLKDVPTTASNQAGPLLPETLGPWGDDVPLNGTEAPEDDGHIEHLIRYLSTVHKRFGNTAVTVELQWGASALWKRSAQRATIERLTAGLELVAYHEDVSYLGCPKTPFCSPGLRHDADCPVAVAELALEATP